MATLTNQTANTASLTNTSLSQRVVGTFTFDEIGTKTLAEMGDKTFYSNYMVFINETAH